MSIDWANKLHVSPKNRSFLMTSDRRDKGSHRIPIKFPEADDEIRSAESAPEDMAREDPDNEAGV